ncbi:MAG: 3-oxoacyl-[acyl-carrier-protein] synthase [Gaiellales bacterium]|jgi:3-oxoacyl-[acyl-carrier-protein] synthase II|nr:3-oxoacyl-[acyl-carrier-protein] synthase [Gaiellales bacterium]
MQRIAITGIGSVSPVGLSTDDAWEALLAGRSGVAEITQFDASDMPVRVAGEVKGFDPVAVAGAKEARRMDRNVLLALAAAKAAAEDAALVVDDPSRFGVLFGTAIGGFHTMMEQHEIMRERGWERVAPWFLPQCLPDVASGAIAQLLDLRGPNMAPISACSTGAHAVMEAAELIRRGDADVVLAGGGEACIHPLIIAGFTTMKGLGSPRPGEGPETASRPFDATRDGFVCAEGATVLVIESVERAERRGARIHAEVLAGGNTNDAYHAVTPRPDSQGVVNMMRVALAKAGIDPSEIGYLNPHGTSTPQGDAAETKAIKEVFGDHAYRMCVSSTKSATGHQFGGAGSFEVAVCALALRDQIVPPTLNYREPDPECDLDYVPEGARKVDVEYALSNSMGLGGHNGCVILRRHHG